jgi:hypothetical protein
MKWSSLNRSKSSSREILFKLSVLMASISKIQSLNSSKDIFNVRSKERASFFKVFAVHASGVMAE